MVYRCIDMKRKEKTSRFIFDDFHPSSNWDLHVLFCKKYFWPFLDWILFLLRKDNIYCKKRIIFRYVINVYFVKSQNGPATVLCVFFIASWWFWSHKYISKSYYLSKITHRRPLNTFTGILESHHQTLKTSLVYDNSILRELSDILAFISIIKPLFFHVIRCYGNTIIMYFEPKT